MLNQSQYTVNSNIYLNRYAMNDFQNEYKIYMDKLSECPTELRDLAKTAFLAGALSCQIGVEKIIFNSNYTKRIAHFNELKNIIAREVFDRIPWEQE